MSANLRVHIAPVGFEFLRVTEPLTKMQADKVYLIRYAEDDAAQKYYVQVKRELEQRYEHIKVEEVHIDIWNLYDCIAKFREIILKEKGNHVYINVSTGTKITAIAGMLSCMLFDATPYYAPVSYPIPKETKGLPTEHVEDPDLLPVYDIRKPTKDEMRVLLLLESNGGTMRKLKLIEELEKEKIIKPKDEKAQRKKETWKHSQLRAILDPMQTKWKFIEVESSGRRSDVSITENGRTALKIFGAENTK